MKKTNNRLIQRSLAGVAVQLLLCSQAPAQIHAPNQQPQQWLTLAEEQYQQGHYQVAAQSARKFLQYPDDPVQVKNLADADKARYYMALALLQLNREEAVDSAGQFIQQTANPVYRQRVSFAVAQYYFRNDQLAKAIPYYESASIANLSNQEIADAKFEQAYCYFNNHQFDKAEPLFATIKEIDGKYMNAGNYYYGLLAYNKGDYASALKSFERINNLPEYKPVVPYYIAEIHYFMGNRQKALDDAIRLIKSSDKSYYDNELHLLAAQCLFEQGKYAEALPYFEHYYDRSDKIRKEELYEIAYCYYQVGKIPAAINNFKELSNSQDSLGQTSMYLLGDCYLKTGDKKSARNAFGICADMPYNSSQREAALFLAGKLSYEMGYADDATRRIGTLLSDYPQSSYRSEARTMFSDLLTKSNNYAEAFRTLQDVPDKDANYRRVLQKAAYGYGLQQMQQGNTAQADSLLSISITQGEDPVYVAAANFWKGDLAYRAQQYDHTISYSEAFLSNAGQSNRTSWVSPQATPQHAYMNMGYAAMKLQQFAQAQSYFSKARLAGTGSSSSGLDATASVREADAAFMGRQYPQALSLYDKVINSGSADADYARFQKATILGLQNKTAEKTAILQSLISRTPASAYADDARYELAVVNIDADKYQQAIDLLRPLTEAKGKYAPKAWIKTGFSYQEMENNTQAIDAYRHVVSDYPASEERSAALDALKTLYIQNNQPAAYAQLLKDNNLPGADEHTLDSTYYAAAESQFGAGKYDKAQQSFDQYLKAYPNGAFALKANYYKAESAYQQKDYKTALSGYDAVLSSNWNDFSENSARKASVIAMQNGDNAAAQRYYQLLRNSAMNTESLQQAYGGLMKSSFNLNQYEATAQYADTLLSLPGINEAVQSEATFYKAKCLQQQSKNDEAIALYKTLGTGRNNAMAAEARYRVAEIYAQQGKQKEAETAAGETIQQSGGYDYWIVKSYILLSDLMVKQKDYFNAKATLQSIIKNTKIADLKQEATKKLEEVKGLEKTKSKLSDDQK
ncbi:tetratricopeptide repeat protein [Chitinophagaceae bacterium MMS25-I14]